MTRFVILGAAAMVLSGCAVAKTTGKVAAAPFKVVGKTAEITGKSIYYTGKGVAKTGEFAGKSVYHTGKFAGESVYYTGKGVYKTAELAGKTVYHVGRTPVVITNAALDTTSNVLRVTEQVIDTGGKIYKLSRDIPRGELEAYLKAVKAAKNVVDVFIDIAG